MPATVWKGFISFGLVSFPVRLFAAARAETVHFHGYEVSKGEYVVVEDDELKKVAPATATTMDIRQFVGKDEVDPILFESSYYVAAEGKTAKPSVLFLAALTDTQKGAIAKVAMHNREHVVLIRPSNGGLVLHTLYYPDELHKANRAETPQATYSTKELELAKSLVNQLTAPFKPQEFEDAYRANVERLIEQKRKGQKITAVKQPAKAPVIDLMEALKRSLKSASAGASKQGKSRPARAPKKTAGRHKAACDLQPCGHNRVCENGDL